MVIKLILKQDFFGLGAINEGFKQYAKVYGKDAIPTKMVLNREEYRDLRSIACSDSEYTDKFQKALGEGRFILGRCEVPIEINDTQFQLI